jgi:hypothetical protein
MLSKDVNKYINYKCSECMFSCLNCRNWEKITVKFVRDDYGQTCKKVKTRFVTKYPLFLWLTPPKYMTSHESQELCSNH